jgi:phosphoserine phosphatase
MLACVGNPVVVGTSTHLERAAARYGWPALAESPMPSR